MSVTENGDLRHNPNTNNPPVPTLEERLKADYAGLTSDYAGWLASAERAPATVDDDTALTNFGLIIKKLNGIRTAAEIAHGAEKAPHLATTRLIDGFFLGMVKRCKEVADALAKRQTVYLNKKEDAARKAADEQAAEARRVSEANMKAAEAAMDKGNLDAAVPLMEIAADANNAADAAERVASAAPADLVRTYGSAGNVVSSSAKWVGEITSLDAMDLNELKNVFALADIQKAINTHVRLNKDTKPLKGVTIKQDRKAINR